MSASFIENGAFSFRLPKNQSNLIKVIGVGGGGSNAVNHMFNEGHDGVDFVICNTDAQALESSNVPTKIQLGKEITSGLGAGADPKVGELAAEESYDEIKKVLENNTKMAFITAGMGGGTGTGAAPVIARAARDLGILTVGIVTLPFTFEGNRRMGQAELGIAAMRNEVDSIIVINNDKLLEVYGDLGYTSGFGKVDEVLSTAARGIAMVITDNYKINIDLNDATKVLKDKGSALMGSALGSGEDRAMGAIMGALDSPLLDDNKITGATDVLLLIVSGSKEVTISEIGLINSYIQEEADSNVNIIMGLGGDPSLGDEVRVTVIATGFSTEKQKEINKDLADVIIHPIDGHPVPEKTKSAVDAELNESPENAEAEQSDSGDASDKTEIAEEADVKQSHTDELGRTIHVLSLDDDELDIESSLQTEDKAHEQLSFEKDLEEAASPSIPSKQATLPSQLVEVEAVEQIPSELEPVKPELFDKESSIPPSAHGEEKETVACANLSSEDESSSEEMIVQETLEVSAMPRTETSVSSLPGTELPNQAPLGGKEQEKPAEPLKVDQQQTSLDFPNNYAGGTADHTAMTYTIGQVDEESKTKVKAVTMGQSNPSSFTIVNKTVERRAESNPKKVDEVVASPLNTSIEEMKRLKERRSRLSKYTYNFDAISSDEPAYQRQGISLDDEPQVERSTSSLDMGVDSADQLKLRSNDSYLHDNVD